MTKATFTKKKAFDSGLTVPGHSGVHDHHGRKQTGGVGAGHGALVEYFTS